ncbi:MAG TPA: hypothetical protein VFE62_16530 [Gemmataceae bacterium]|nr:hypothetical protein [Gemmataceae bacterium]
MQRVLCSLAVLLCVAFPPIAFGQADNLPRFPGLRSEIRKADHLVRVKVTDWKWRDKPGEVAVIDGTIVEVYKGKLEPKQAIQFEVDGNALRSRIDTFSKVFGEIDTLYYLPVAPYRKNATGVFLMSAGQPPRVVGVLRDDIGQPAEYVKLSRMSDADAALGLVKLLYHCVNDKHEGSWHSYENTLLQDLRVHYRHLDTKGAAFRTFLADRKQAVLRSLGESSYLQLDVAVWLTAHMDERDRREGLKTLLRAFEENAKEMDKLRADAKKPAGKGQGIQIDQLTQLGGVSRALLGSMALIYDPTWTREIVNIRNGVIIRGCTYSYEKLDAKEVLAKVRAFTQK